MQGYNPDNTPGSARRRRRRPAGTGERLGTVADVAALLGVTTGSVGNWYRRRHRNGFPEPACVRRATNGMDARHWDLDEMLAWFLTRNV